MTTQKQALNWSNELHYWILAALAAGRDPGALIGTRYASDGEVDGWDVDTGLVSLHRWGCRSGNEVTPFGHELLAVLAERYNNSAPLKPAATGDRPTPAQIAAAIAAAYGPRAGKHAKCDDCGLVYDVNEHGVPVTCNAYTCDDCGGYVELVEA